jgi:signal transduction histidine kinase
VAKKDVIEHYYNTFIWSLLHYFVYSVPFDITTIPFFGLNFTILFILYHSTLLQYLFLVSTSLFCLFCAVQHYYNTFFWSLLHYFVYSVPFNITTIHLFGLYFTIVYSVAFDITITSFFATTSLFFYSVPFNITWYRINKIVK